MGLESCLGWASSCPLSPFWEDDDAFRLEESRGVTVQVMPDPLEESFTRAAGFEYFVDLKEEPVIQIRSLQLEELPQRLGDLEHLEELHLPLSYRRYRFSCS